MKIIGTRRCLAFFVGKERVCDTIPDKNFAIREHTENGLPATKNYPVTLIDDGNGNCMPRSFVGN